MVEITDDEFNKLVEAAVHDIPERYAKHLANVAFITDDLPTRDQLRASGILHGGATLLGLYQGIPLPNRGNGYNGVVPDIITIFKRPHVMMARDADELRHNVHQTVWHEVAHYFGLNHGQIHALER